MCHETCKVGGQESRRASMNLPNRKRRRYLSAPLIFASLLILQPHVFTRPVDAFSQVQPKYGTCVRSAGTKSFSTFGVSEAHGRQWSLLLAMDGGGNDNNGNDGTNNGRGGGGGGNGDNDRDGENNNEEDENSDEQFGFIEKKQSTRAIRLFGGGLLTLIFHRGESQLPQTAMQLASSAAESPTHRSLVAVLLAYHTQLSKMAKNHFSSASKSMAKSSIWYMTRLETHPLITKCITGGIIGFLGDIGAQCFAHKLEQDSNNANANGSNGDVTSLADHSSSASMQYDVRRGLSAMASAMLFTGPILHYSYDLFERLLPVSKMPKGFRTLASSAHVMADALLLDSVFVALNMLVTGVLEGYKFREDIIPQFQADYMGTLKTSWGMSAIIAPYQLVCFRFLPASLRVLGVNFSDVAWDGVVSYKNHMARGSAPNAAVDSI